MRKIVPVFLLVFLSGTAYAHEFFVNAGVTRDTQNQYRAASVVNHLSAGDWKQCWPSVFRISTRGMR